MSDTMNNRPWFPTIQEHAETIRLIGWDQAHIAIVTLFGFKAADELDKRYMRYILGKDI